MNKEQDLIIARKWIEKQGLYLFQTTDIELFVDCLVDAYSDCPLFDYIFKNKSSRMALYGFWKTYIRFAKDRSLIFADSKNVNGVSIWYLPKFDYKDAYLYIKNGGWQLPFVTRQLFVLSRINNYANYANAIHSKYIDQNAWYLFSLAVRQGYQNTGVASKMINTVLRLVDMQKLPVYLETHNEKNRNIYENFDFQLSEVATLSNEANLRHFAMLRPAVV